MSNMTPQQPVVLYQVEASVLEQLITRAVVDAMERYTTSTPDDSKSREQDLMTVPEVCEYLHVTAATLHNWHRVGYLTKTKIGRRVLYHRSDVEAIANNNIK